MPYVHMFSNFNIFVFNNCASTSSRLPHLHLSWQLVSVSIGFISSR